MGERSQTNLPKTIQDKVLTTPGNKYFIIMEKTESAT